MDRLLLIDGHSVAYRAFFALPVENFSTTTGQHTNAVFGFTSMLINVLRDEKPTHLGVAFDVSRKTFRSEEYADYKGNRSKSPAEFTGQISLIKDVLEALRRHDVREGRLRGRRHHRHAHHAGQCRGHGGADLHRRPRRLPARQRRDHRALPAQGRLRPRPLDADRSRGEVRRHARPLSRPRRIGGRDQRQPARRPRRRAQDRRQVDRLLRHARRPRGRRRAGAGQGGGGPARPPRRRAAQPPHQRAGLRPRPSRRPRRPGVHHGVEPQRHPRGVRRPGVRSTA